MTMAESTVRMGKCICESDLCCGSSFLMTWEQGDEYVRCPLCNNLVKVPEDSRSFPPGRHNILACGKPWDDHDGAYCPHERKTWK